MPLAISGHAAAVLGGTIYVVGGVDQGGTTNSSLLAYDTATKTWRTKASMPTGRIWLAAVSLGGMIYAIGGDAGSASSAVQAYDPSTDAWTSRASLPSPVIWPSASVVGGSIYVTGGLVGATSSNALRIYDPVTDTWTSGPSMIGARQDHASATIAGTLYVVGGRTQAGSQLSSGEQLGPSGGTWFSIMDLPSTRSSHAAASLGPEMFVLGGVQNSVITGCVVGSDPATGAWRCESGMPTAREWMAAATVGGTIYALGGIDQSLTDRSTNEAASLAADLPGSLVVTPAVLSVGLPVTVTFTVTNLGGTAVYLEKVALRNLTDPAMLAAPAGPTPTTPLWLSGGATMTFTWTYSASGSGFLWLDATTQGLDAASGMYAGSACATMMIAAAAVLDSALTVTPSPATAGSVIQARFIVRNCGGVGATVYAPALQNNSSSWYITPLTGPSAVAPFILSGGCTSTRFVWTFSVTGAGALSLTTTDAGVSTATGIPLTTSSSASVTLNPAAALAAALTISPGQAAVGQLLSVALTVTNTGVAGATLLVPSLLDLSAGSYQRVVAGPAPPGPLVLLAGGSTTFLWTASVTGHGLLVLTGLVTGVDALSGAMLATSAAASATLVAPAQLTVALSAPSRAIAAGEDFQLVATARNLGYLDALSLTTALTWSGSGTATQIGASPAGTSRLAGGASQTFTWAFQASTGGSVRYTVVIFATSAYDSSPLSATSSAHIAITFPPALYTGPVRVFPNPFNPGTAARGTVKFEGVRAGDLLRVYTASGALVWETTPASPGVLEWDGRNLAGRLVAPGVYQWTLAGEREHSRGKLVVE